MQYNNRNIVLAELIGLRAKVVKCLDKKQIGLEGLIVDETKNTLLLETERGVKRIVKATATFRLYAGNRAFTVDGQEINFRPHERIEKGLRFYKKRRI